MSFVAAVLIFASGIVLLWFGAEWLVRGSAALGRAAGISKLVVGLTVVACATSAPELMVSLVAALRGIGDLALGNVVGSNIANVGLVLGLCALVASIRLDDTPETREVPAMLGVSVLFLALSWSGATLSRGDGVVLLAVLAVVLGWLVRSTARRGGEVHLEEVAALEREPVSRMRSFLLLVVGLAVLLFGAELMTRSGAAMARILNVPETIIGLTMVALGTSLPELAASLVSVLRGHPELAFGNVVGSNLLNLSFVAGTVATVHPLTVEAGMRQVEIPIMLGFSLVMFLMMRRGRTFGRLKGAILLAAYLLYIVRLTVEAGV